MQWLHLTLELRAGSQGALCSQEQHTSGGFGILSFFACVLLELGSLVMSQPTEERHDSVDVFLRLQTAQQGDQSHRLLDILRVGFP